MISAMLHAHQISHKVSTVSCPFKMERIVNQINFLLDNPPPTLGHRERFLKNYARRSSLNFPWTG